MRKLTGYIDGVSPDSVQVRIPGNPVAHGDVPPRTRDRYITLAGLPESFVRGLAMGAAVTLTLEQEGGS